MLAADGWFPGNGTGGRVVRLAFQCVGRAERIGANSPGAAGARLQCPRRRARVIVRT